MKTASYLLLLCMLTTTSLAQDPNPFDITPPAKTTLPASPQNTPTQTELPPQYDTTNPFELQPHIARPRKTALDDPKAENPFVNPPSLTLQRAQKFIDKEPIFWLSLMSLFLFAILHNLKRRALPTLFKSLLNPNLVHQLTNSTPLHMGFLFSLYHLFALIQVAVFLFMVLEWWGIFLHLEALLLLTVLLIAAVYLYQILLQAVGYIYHMTKRTRSYVMHLRLYEIVLGLTLAPINFLSTLLPPSVAHWILLLGLGCIALYGILRLSRLISIAQPWRRAHTFYFILYFCTFEISPLLLLGRGLSYIGLQWT